MRASPWASMSGPFGANSLIGERPQSHGRGHDEQLAKDGKEARVRRPSVRRAADGYVISGSPPERPATNEYPHQSAPAESSRPQTEAEQYEEWRHYNRNRVFDPASNESLRRHGLILTIVGGVLLTACGSGILMLIPGIILVSVAARRRRWATQR